MGFGYIPTPRYNAFRTRVDLFKLVRQLKLRSFFGDSPGVTGVRFRPRSTFIPCAYDQCISTFEKVVLRDIELMERKPLKTLNNLSADERQALNQLANDNSIVIKPAYKGGGVVILNRTDYEAEVCRQLEDTTSYVKLQNDPTKAFTNSIRVLIQEGLALDYIDKTLSEFLINTHPRVPIFYVLPKVHKPGFPPVGRPIVAAMDSLLELISQYIDSILQPSVKRTPTFLLDTTDFIGKMEGFEILESSLLTSLDVRSLYTSIPHDELRVTLQEILDRRPDPHPPTHFLLGLIDALMEMNYF